MKNIYLGKKSLKIQNIPYTFCFVFFLEFWIANMEYALCAAVNAASCWSPCGRRVLALCCSPPPTQCSMHNTESEHGSSHLLENRQMSIFPKTLKPHSRNSFVRHAIKHILSLSLPLSASPSWQPVTPPWHISGFRIHWPPVTAHPSKEMIWMWMVKCVHRRYFKNWWVLSQSLSESRLVIIPAGHLELKVKPKVQLSPASCVFLRPDFLIAADQNFSPCSVTTYRGDKETSWHFSAREGCYSKC